MARFRKVNNHRAAPGLEWRILKKMPVMMLGATLVPLLMSGLARVLPLDLAQASSAKQILSIDIFSIAIAITAWTALFTVAIGCVVVWIMKGPRYEADSYRMNESERPRRDDECER